MDNNNMNDEKVNTNIEKYDFESFEKEHLPFTMIPNQVIQTLIEAHRDEGMLWIYLQSLPPDWEPNKYHILKKLNISERTYHKLMKFLVNCILVEYRRYRKPNGQLGEVTIRVLNGTKFQFPPNPNHTAKICIVDSNHTAKKPQCGEATMVANCAHTNTTINTNSNKDHTNVCGAKPSQHTQKDLKKEEVEKKAFNDNEANILFQSKFKYRNVAYEHLFESCRLHYESKGQWVTVDKWLKWLNRENQDNFAKQKQNKSNSYSDEVLYSEYLGVKQARERAGQEFLSFEEWKKIEH